jgi:hypothetical protein
VEIVSWTVPVAAGLPVIVPEMSPRCVPEKVLELTFTESAYAVVVWDEDVEVVLEVVEPVLEEVDDVDVVVLVVVFDVVLDVVDVVVDVVLEVVDVDDVAEVVDEPPE